MLLLFKVKNYTSFKEEVILDMRAASYVQHPTHCVQVNDKVSLLKTNAIYGANASGKSNFISAMFFFSRYILSQFIGKNENLDFDEVKKAKTKLEPFALSDRVDNASEFEIIFLVNGTQIQYGFECTSDAVLNEWYLINDKEVFERKGNDITYGSKYKKMLSSYNKVPAQRLYLSVLEYFLEEEHKSEILGNFIDFFKNEYHIFMGVFLESAVKGVAGSYSHHKKLVEDEAFLKKVEKYLQMIDVGIKGLDIQEVVTKNRKTGEEETRKVIKTIHQVYDDTGEATADKYFDLNQESSGTLNFFRYIQDIITLLENGGVFIVDEFSARLHPKLTKLIVDIFQSDDNKKAQLIFTTHDISLLNNGQFRRDEVSFIDKNERGESRLYALSDKKVRDDASFSKDYMQGKYGAVPVFDYDELIRSKKNDIGAKNVESKNFVLDVDDLDVQSSNESVLTRGRK
jgi:hypothetical protein